MELTSYWYFAPFTSCCRLLVKFALLTCSVPLMG